MPTAAHADTQAGTADLLPAACAAVCNPVNEVNLVPSLLQAIVNIDGEALVMHAGDKPYVVSPTGQVELASRGLTLDAVSGIVAQLLPVEFQNALDEFGAVQYTLPPQAEFPHERFTVVVARGGDDVWAEIRRKRVRDDDRIPGRALRHAAAVRSRRRSRLRRCRPRHLRWTTTSWCSRNLPPRSRRSSMMDWRCPRKRILWPGSAPARRRAGT